MTSHPKQNIGCFTADFRGKKVAIGGRVFPVGFFFCNSLNEYWREAPNGEHSNPAAGWLIANRLLSTHQPMWNVEDDLLLGYLDEAEAAKLHDNIQYILKVIAKARPFKYLDLDAEKSRCDALFGTESVQLINAYLREKAQHTLNSDSFGLSGNQPNHNEIKRLAEKETHLRDFISTLDFYNKLGLDMNAALDFARGFVERLPYIPRRDENHLIQLAMECMKQVPFGRWNQLYQSTFSPEVEYVAVPKKPHSKNYTVGKRMTFTRFLDFLIADFFEGLHNGHYPQICQNCGRYFLKTNAHAQKYCTFTDPKDPLKRACQAVAAAKGRAAKELAADHPIKAVCENRLKVIRIQLKRERLSKEQAKAAKKVAQERRDRALADAVYANTLYPKEMEQVSIYEAAGIELS
ncbi:MAG: DUF6076 domain-containing protein [Clostridiales bacterium]|nr:DUF6076 domain-containing protein [Clostridiales bacterium]